MAVTCSSLSPGTHISIDYADGLGGPLAIKDALGGTSAEELGIATSGLAGTPVDSHDLDPLLVAESRLDQLFDGAGLTPGGTLEIRQGDELFTIDLNGLETVGELIIEINNSPADIQAQIDPSRGAIDILALRAGVDYSIGGNAATELGLRTETVDINLAELNSGIGIETVSGPDLIIRRNDGSVLDIDIDLLTTIGDLLDAINLHPNNVGASSIVTAELNPDGSGLQLSSPTGALQLTLQQPNGTDAGVVLGLLDDGANTIVGTPDAGSDVIRGSEFARVAPQGVFDTLLRLRDAVLDGNIEEITRLAPQIDEHLSEATTIRGEVGARTQNLQNLRQQTESFQIELETQLSDQIDADFAQVVSDMTLRQTAVEASLRLMGQLSQLTVLNFL